MCVCLITEINDNMSSLKEGELVQSTEILVSEHL